MILAIDPGNKESAFVLVKNDLSRVVTRKKLPNADLLDLFSEQFCRFPIHYVAIEMVASYGMPVGAEVFETCVMIGRIYEASIQKLWKEPTLIYRMDEKMTLCHNSRAKDSNIRQALIDRFGPVGTKKDPGYFYGFKKDIWAAMAVAVAFHDKHLEA